MPSNHLILCHPLLLLPSIFPSIRVFSSELALGIRWPEYWSFSFIISSSNEYSRFISFRMDWFDLASPRDSQKSSLAPQLERISSSALSLLYGPALTTIHDSWENCGFDETNLCQQRGVSAFQYTVLGTVYCHSFSSKVCLAVYLCGYRVVCEGLAGSLRLPLSAPGTASPCSVGRGTRLLFQEEEAQRRVCVAPAC